MTGKDCRDEIGPTSPFIGFGFPEQGCSTRSTWAQLHMTHSLLGRRMASHLNGCKTSKAAADWPNGYTVLNLLQLVRQRSTKTKHTKIIFTSQGRAFTWVHTLCHSGKRSGFVWSVAGA